MAAATLLSLFGRLRRPFPVPARTASAAWRSRGQGRPAGRRAKRAFLDGGEHGRTLWFAGRSARTSRAWRAAVLSLLLTSCGYCASAEPRAVASISPRRALIGEAVEEAAARFGLPVSWIEAVIAAESGGDPFALSPKGAMGLMQLMPPTWRELSVELGLGPDPFQHRDNILAGAAYLRRLYDRFGRSGFLAAYNAGPARYQAVLDGQRKLPAETIAYVAAVESRIDRSVAGIPGLVPPKISDWRAAGIFVSPISAQPPSVDRRTLTTVMDPPEPAVRP
ncbi:lytic transglycosylase domain-containing protein [Caulobacter hibisci]|uniref:Lytic transglycosylase domain-containing protein n=1 Tax=Caulobacter hibisci TaxID=2035993 RepID=A0ABS0T7E8_9CAUL|nr:lytic transglycosylase domain-containing protein [Caulobacter hibisci]MBI1686782.1 lytic transglycosylase domain-containing protein [Caulobacter hibisci]